MLEKRRAGCLRLLPLLLVVGSGCGTISNLAGGNLFEKGPEAFGGIRQNAETMRQGGGHEGLVAVFACMDMPFSLALDVVVLPVTLPIELLRETPPEAKIHAMLLRMNKRILRAETISLKFSLEKMQPEPMTATGTLLIKKGGKVRLEVVLRSGGKERKVLYVSDGKYARGVIDGVSTSLDPSPELLESMLRKIVFSGGLLTNAWAPPGDFPSLLKDPVLRTTVTASFHNPEDGLDHEMKYGWAYERSAKREGDLESIWYELDIYPPKLRFGVDLWYDPKTLVWVRRVLRPTEREEVGAIEEKYEEFRLDADLPDESFTLPR
jgi:uncharacterized protein YceK